jgi:serine/threonine-protein kinase RsbW
LNTSMMSAKRTIKFPSVLQNITVAEKLVDDVCNEYKVTEEHYGGLLVAITEAVSNAIVHGNQMDDRKQVTLTFDIVDNTNARFMIEDEGPGFDYEHLPDPTAPENIERPNGRGVFLMKRLSDHCEFTENGSIVILDFNILSSTA